VQALLRVCHGKELAAAASHAQFVACLHRHCVIVVVAWEVNVSKVDLMEINARFAL
jgi:hypothetical protein